MKKIKTDAKETLTGDDVKCILLDMAIEEKALFTARLIIGLRGDITETEADLILHFMAIETVLAAATK